MKQEHFDVVVIGGGPGGSTLATFVAQAGYRVLLLERESFPRYQIGESLLPPTIGLCHRLGLGEALEGAGFTPKNGGVWYWGTDDVPGWGFDFSELPKAPLYGSAWAYQVERSKFDTLLLQNARDKGVVVRELHKVVDLIEDEGRVVGVRYEDDQGAAGTVHARFVADAGGHTSVFHRQVGERVYAERFRNLALHCYYEGGKRLPEPQSGSILNVSFDKGWFWYIPLAPNLTSLGAVISTNDAPLLRVGLEEAMNSFIESCPLIKHYLGDTPRVTTGPYGQYRVRRDWSYSNTRFWKPGLVLIGDAACFVDPLFSSGVHLATYSAFLASRTILTTLEHPALEQRAFQAFETAYRKEYQHFFDYLSFFYDTHHDKEEYFRQARDVLGTTESAKQAFVRLVGGFSTNTPAPRPPPAILQQPLGVPGSKPASASRVVDTSPGNQDVARTLQQGEQGMPLTEALYGLIPSGDGLRWVDAGAGRAL